MIIRIVGVALLAAGIAGCTGRDREGMNPEAPAYTATYDRPYLTLGACIYDLIDRRFINGPTRHIGQFTKADLPGQVRLTWTHDNILGFEIRVTETSPRQSKVDIMMHKALLLGDADPLISVLNDASRDCGLNK